MSCLSCRISKPAVRVGFLSSVSDLWDPILPVYYTWRNTACLQSSMTQGTPYLINPLVHLQSRQAKVEKLARLGKRWQKNAKPCLIPCSATASWPLSASSTVVAQPACASEDLHDKKGNMACVVDIQRWNEFYQSKIVFATQESFCHCQGHLCLRKKSVKAEGGNKASWQTMFLWKPARIMLNSSVVLVKCNEWFSSAGVILEYKFKN